MSRSAVDACPGCGGAVRQDDDVGGEPVAAEVTALPDVHGAGRRHGPGQRPSAQRDSNGAERKVAHQLDGLGR